MTKKQKLELTWIGKEKRPQLEPRILLEDPAKSHHAKHRVSDNDIFDNRLIFGLRRRVGFDDLDGRNQSASRHGNAGRDRKVRCCESLVSACV